MKFIKPVLIVFAFIALTYSVSAHKVSFNELGNKAIKASDKNAPERLPINDDLLFALTAIASLGGYLIFKK